MIKINHHKFKAAEPKDIHFFTIFETQKSSRLKKAFSRILTRSYTSGDIFLWAFIFLCFNILINVIHGFQGYCYPYTSFLFLPGDRFGDFFKPIHLFNVVNVWDNLDPPDSKYILAGRPFVNVYNYTLAHMIKWVGNGYAVLWLFYISCIASFVAIARKYNNSWLIIALAILSYPVIFTLDRGNFALLVFVMLLLALATNNSFISILLIVISTGLRLTPIVFIILFIIKKPITLKRTATIITFSLLGILIINDFSIWFIREIILIPNYDPAEVIARELRNYNEIYILGWDGLPYTSSIFLPLKWLIAKASLFSFSLEFIKPITVAAGIYFIIGLWLLSRGLLKKSLLMITDFEKMVPLVCFSFVLLMPITGDYYLLILFIPLIMYPGRKYSFWYFLLFALLLAPKNFIYLENINRIHPLSLQVFINPFLLLALLLCEFNLLNAARKESETSGSIEKNVKESFSA